VSNFSILCSVSYACINPILMSMILEIEYGIATFVLNLFSTDYEVMPILKKFSFSPMHSITYKEPSN